MVNTFSVRKFRLEILNYLSRSCENFGNFPVRNTTIALPFTFQPKFPKLFGKWLTTIEFAASRATCCCSRVICNHHYCKTADFETACLVVLLHTRARLDENNKTAFTLLRKTQPLELYSRGHVFTSCNLNINCSS